MRTLQPAVRKKTLDILPRKTSGYYSYAEIGKFLGISKQRVEQIEIAAFKKIKNAMSEEKLKQLEETIQAIELNQMSEYKMVTRCNRRIKRE